MLNKDLISVKNYWDNAAKQFSNYEIPAIYNNNFMKYLYLKDVLNTGSSKTAVDIGCGAGKYSLAIAPYFKRVLGTDISDNMLEAAEKRKLAEKIENVDFKCISWQEIDIEKEGLVKSFDFAFAHMTPAVNDKDEIEKLRSLSRKYCAVTKSTYRNNQILDHIYKMLNIENNDYGVDSLINLFEVLWANKITPDTFYEKEVWSNEFTVDELTENYFKRLSMKNNLSDNDKDKIREYLNSIAVDGKINENTDVILCTVFWDEEEAK